MGNQIVLGLDPYIEAAGGEREPEKPALFGARRAGNRATAAGEHVQRGRIPVRAGAGICPVDPTGVSAQIQPRIPGSPFDQDDSTNGRLHRP
jgi:hypothetical protein